jgi:hypothetical protein
MARGFNREVGAALTDSHGQGTDVGFREVEDGWQTVNSRFGRGFFHNILAYCSARLWAGVVNKHGGDATVISLPEIGITGNTHFIMSDLNNLEIADHLADWLAQKGL